jgi:NTE family protein
MTTQTDHKMCGNDLQGRFEALAERNDFLTAGKVEDKVGLCLSGGGYRAMLYHTGAVLRLNELGFLPTLAEVASVSGGSITAAVLALAWPSLRFDERGVASNLIDAFVGPVTRFASVSIDVRAILLSLLPGVSAASEIARAYDRHLFHGATLQDLPEAPRFTFMATNLQTGSGWRFAKDYAADHRVGRIDRPSIPLSQVVAASSAFPPFLSPARIPLAGHGVAPMPGADLHRPPFTVEAVLTDGGVYDNLGLERVWRRCRTILVSNAGGSIPEIGRPSGKWVGQIFRTLHLIHQQAEYSRMRLLFGVHNLKQRNVAFWSIETPISAYGVSDAVDLGVEATRRAAVIRTRLNRFTPSEIGLLLEAGYAGADASLRARGIASNLPRADLSRLPRDLWQRVLQ